MWNRRTVGLMIAGWIGTHLMPRGVLAGQFNAVLSLGDRAPAWAELPGTDGKRHSLADLESFPLLVVVFTCNSCPYAIDYEDRLVALGKKYSANDSQVAVVAINVNTIPSDRMEAMKERAESKGFPFAYLFDETQEIARKFGAARTPECFLLDRDRKILYMGAIDDSSDPAKVTQRYLEDAIAQSLTTGKILLGETPPVGCRIRYQDGRRPAKSR
ncbi:MAG: thioredoxin family protein [Pirellulaceae bacterium]